MSSGLQIRPLSKGGALGAASLDQGSGSPTPPSFGAAGGRAAGPACMWPQGGSGTKFSSFPPELQRFPAGQAPRAFLGARAIFLQLPLKGLCQAERPPEGDTAFAFIILFCQEVFSCLPSISIATREKRWG